MVEVKVLYRENEEEHVWEILKALEQINRDRFLFFYQAFKATKGMLKNER